MNQLLKNVLYLCVILVCVACKKTRTPAVSTRLNFIAGDISKDWYIRNAVITFTENGADRQLNLSLDCERDDIWNFSRDGKLIVHDNASKCQGQPEVRLNTFWVADDTFDNMTITNWRFKDSGDLTNVKFSVSKLTDSTMTLNGAALLPNIKSLVINYLNRP